MEQAPFAYRRKEEPEFDLREEFLKACITREKTNSRRFSASNLTSFREEARSFRHQNTISSTASSPGYTPKALQARAGSGWECLSGNPLHSKWNEAERYICNPLSGQVPLECLSAKTLSGRSLPAPSRITKSGPLVFTHARLVQARTTITHQEEEEDEEQATPTAGKEAAVERRIGRNGQLTRDMGTQSTPIYLSSGSNSPELAPPIKEIPLTSCQVGGGEPLSFHLNAIAKEDPVGEKEKQETERKSKEMHKSKGGTCLGWGLLVGKKDVVANTNKKENCRLSPWRFCSQVGGKSIEKRKTAKDSSIMIAPSLPT